MTNMNKYNIVYKNPSVKLIDTNSTDIMKNLWIKSRESIVTRSTDDTAKYTNVVKVGSEDVSNDLEGYFDRIIKMGLQYTNFTTYTFEIEGSTLFRDLLYTINKNPAWSTSLRFVNSTFDVFDSRNYPVSSEYKDIPEWVTQINKYFDKINETMVTDENRVEMPYCMHHRFWVQMNFKTLVGFLSLLKSRMPFFYKVYGKLIEDCIPDITKYYVDYTDSSLGQYFFKGSIPSNESFTKYGDQVVMHKSMGLLLYSQFIRQQDSKIKGLFNLLEHDDPDKFSHKVFYAGTIIMIEYSSDYERFIRTISNRTCWFSMSSGNDLNSWSSILNIVLNSITLNEFEELIPCRIHNKCIKCKYYDDVKFRIEGSEKRNLPCGLALMNPDIINKRKSYDNNLLSTFYELLYNKWSTEGVTGYKE